MRIHIKPTAILKLIGIIIILYLIIYTIFCVKWRLESKFISTPDDLFPTYSSNAQDRIVKQLNFKAVSLNGPKTVVLYGVGKREDIPSVLRSCPINQCVFTDNDKLQQEADAIVFTSSQAGRMGNINKPKNQVWVYFELESPLHSISNVNSKVNFTATYRRDSVLVTPYEKFVPYINQTNYRENLKKKTTTRNYAKGKHKMVAWFVSNCNAPNGRMAYVKELQKYVSVDIYGGCGSAKCPRHKAATCFQKLNTDYKFYLAFENSNCVDYITEKLYWNALNNDVVPIVMGARKEDYDAVVPPYSFIHVDDFESPEHLAEYLKFLDANDNFYNNYFKWKGTGEFINTKFWCRLCAVLHASEKYKIWYDDFSNWWNPHGICVHPTKERLWSTWRNNTKQLNIKTWNYEKYS